MLPCIFLRIEDNVYNVNLINKIFFKQTKYESSDHTPFVKISIIFNDCIDVPSKHFYTYYTSIGQLLYDWEHSKASFFEIPYLELKQVIAEDKKCKEKTEKEIEYFEDQQVSDK